MSVDIGTKTPAKTSYLTGEYVDLEIVFLLSSRFNVPQQIDPDPHVATFEWAIKPGTDVNASTPWQVIPPGANTTFRLTKNTYRFLQAGNYILRYQVTFTEGNSQEIFNYLSASGPDVPAAVLGCMDPAALNYNPNATQSDGSCQYAPAEPTDPTLCPIPELASLEFLKLHFVKNPVELKLMSGSSGNRGLLRYYADLLVPPFLHAPGFVKLVGLEATERPPYKIGQVEYLDYAYFFLEDYLASQLKTKAPAFRQKDILPVQTHTLPFKLDWKILPGTEVGSEQPKWAFNGGLSFEDFPSWKDQFFTDFLSQQRRFLTWQPTQKTVSRDSQEYLYYLVNYTPLPFSLQAVVRVQFADGTCKIKTAVTLNSVRQYEVYIVPAGFRELGLDTETKAITSYQVWVANQSGARLSEIRTFTLDEKYRRNRLEFLVGNSLGGFDTLSCLGGHQFEIETNGEVVQKNLTREYQVQEGQSYKIGVEGQKTITANTGWLTRAQMDYMQEVLLSEEIYLVDDHVLIPVILTSKKLNYKNDDDRLKGYKLDFVRTQVERNYSQLKEFTPAVRYGNVYMSELVTKNNCAPGTFGSIEIIRVEKDTFFSTVSQADANAKAQTWLNENKQALANAQGTCQSEWIGQATYRCQGSNILIIENNQIVNPDTRSSPLNTGSVEQLFINQTTQAQEWRLTTNPVVPGTCPLPILADFKQTIITTDADWAYIQWVYQLDPVPAAGTQMQVNFAGQITNPNNNGGVANVDNRNSGNNFFPVAPDGTFRIQIASSLVYSFQRKSVAYQMKFKLTAVTAVNYPAGAIAVGVSDSNLVTIPQK